MTLFLTIGFPQTDSSNVKKQDLRPSFAHVQLRQGRSPLLPTLPYQQTNRYAVVGIREFLLSQTRVSFICFPTRKDTLQMIKGRETYAQKKRIMHREKGARGNCIRHDMDAMTNIVPSVFSMHNAPC